MPGLHITLGIFYRLFVLLEEACHLLDVKLANAGRQEDTLHSFKLYSTALQNISELEEEKQREEEEASAAEQLRTFLAVRGADVQQVEFCRQAAAELRHKVVTLVSPQTVKITQINNILNTLGE